MTQRRGTVAKPTRSTKRKQVARTVAVVERDERSLTDQQTLWLEQYFICNLNATEAAMIAYDVSDRTVAASIGSENLRKPLLRSRINERLDEFHLSANEVLARLAFMARGSMEEFIDADSGTIDLKKARDARKLGLVKRFKTKFTTTTRTLAPISLADDEETVSRSVVEEVEVLETEIELYDAQSALVNIGKHHSLWNDNAININFNQLSDADLEALAAGKSIKTVSIEAAK